MNKQKATKRALLLSALSLLLCVSMLVGSTFAWFTDSVTSAGNIIKSGKLEVTMEWKDATATGAQQSYKDASQGAIFNYEKWEPGYVEAKNIKIENAGTLAFKYQLTIEATGTVSDLAKVIDVYFADDELTLTDRTMAGMTRVGTLAEVLAGMPTNAQGEILADGVDKDCVTIALKMQENAGNEYQDMSIGTSFAVKLVATQLTAETDSFDEKYDSDAQYPVVTVVDRKDNTKEDTLTAELNNDNKLSVVIPVGAPEGNYELRIPEEAVTTDDNGNTTASFEINLLKDGVKVDPVPGVTYSVSIEVGKNLNLTAVKHNGVEIAAFDYDSATGFVTFETDSFSPFEVVYYTGVIESADSVVELVGRGGEFKLESDIALAEGETIVIEEGETVVLDLNGKTITGNVHKSVGHVIVNNGTLTILNGTVTSGANNGGSAIQNNGTLIADGVVLNGAPNADGSWPSYAVNNTGVMTADNIKLTSYHGAVASYGPGALVTLNDCEISMVGISGFTSHGMYTYNDGAIVVNGGNYVNSAADQGATGASVINGAVTITAGNFSGRVENYYGNPVISGGSFSVKPNANFIVEGYDIIEGNGMYTVVKGTAVKTADELIAALEAGKDVVFANDIKIEPASMSNAYGTTGINIKNGQTVDGNGFTLNIKGAGGTWDSGINTTGGIIKDLKVTGSFRGIFVNHTSTHSETVVLENVTLEDVVYTVSCDQGLYQNLVAYNSTFNGWTSFAATIGTATFTDCSFGAGNGYKFMRPYAPTTYVGCDFCEGYKIDAVKAVVLENCTLNGEPVTAENVATLINSNIQNVTVK